MTLTPEKVRAFDTRVFGDALPGSVRAHQALLEQGGAGRDPTPTHLRDPEIEVGPFGVPTAHLDVRYAIAVGQYARSARKLADKTPADITRELRQLGTPDETLAFAARDAGIPLEGFAAAGLAGLDARFLHQRGQYPYMPDSLKSKSGKGWSAAQERDGTLDGGQIASAVKRLQGFIGATVDGQAGPQTRQNLWDAGSDQAKLNAIWADPALRAAALWTITDKDNRDPTTAWTGQTTEASAKITAFLHGARPADPPAATPTRAGAQPGSDGTRGGPLWGKPLKTAVETLQRTVGIQNPDGQVGRATLKEVLESIQNGSGALDTDKAKNLAGAHAPALIFALTPQGQRNSHTAVNNPATAQQMLEQAFAVAFPPQQPASPAPGQ